MIKLFKKSLVMGMTFLMLCVAAHAEVASNDDYGNTAEDGAKMALNQPMKGAINYKDDEDYFCFIPRWKMNIMVTLEGENVTYSIVDVTNNRGISENEVLLPDNIYAIVVYSKYAGHVPNPEDTYKIGINQVAPRDDYPDAATEATPIALKQDIVGSINYKNDEDYFAFVPEGKMNIKVVLEGTAVTYGIVDVMNNQAISENSVLLPGNTYAIAVYPKIPNQVPNSEYIYKLRIEQVAPLDDYGNTAEHGVRMAFNQPLTGSINYMGDEDYFCFIPRWKMNIEVSLEGKTVTYSIIDVTNNKVISEDEVLLPDNVYAIVVYSKVPNKMPSSEDIYKIGIQEVAPRDDYSDTVAAAAPITLNRDIVGSINYKNDEDFFGFIPEAKMNIKVVLEGENVTYSIVDVTNNRGVGENEVFIPGNKYVIAVFPKDPNRVPNSEDIYKLTVVPKLLEEETSWKKYGDVNGDGQLNSLDYALMRKAILGQDLSNITFDYDAADLTGDGIFNSLDYGWFNKYLLGQVKIFPRDKNEDGYIND